MKAFDQTALLTNLRLAAPCNKDWDNMPGDERVRFCNACSKNVYNISDMSTKDADTFLRENGVSKCMRIFRRTDGTVINDNCPVGLRKLRDGFRWAAALVTGAISFCFAATAALAQGTQDAFAELLGAEEIVGTSGIRPVAKPEIPIVTGTVDLGGFSAYWKGPEMEEVTKGDDKKSSKALRKKLLTTKFPKAFAKAVNFHQLHDWEHAITSYREALKEDPQFDSTYTNLALCLIERKSDGDLDEAADLLSRSKSLSSNKSKGNRLFALARLSEERGDLDSAVKNYQASLNQQGLNLIAIKQLAELHVRMKNPQLAREVITRALRYPKLVGFDELYEILSGARANLDHTFGLDKTPTPNLSPTTDEILKLR